MRTLGFRTHVLLAIAGAIGVVYSLSRPWYARRLAAPDARTSRASATSTARSTPFSDGVRALRWRADGVSGWQALDHWGR